MQSYEDAVSFLGNWGPFQRRVFILLSLLSIPCGYVVLSVIFLLAVPPHHCSIPVSSNLSQDWIQASIPEKHVAGKLERSSCSRYRLDLVLNLSAGEDSLHVDHVQNLSVLLAQVPSSDMMLEGCRDGWIYCKQYYQSTVVTEFNLVCSDQWKQPLVSLLYFVGGLCGCFISGQMADRFGRKPTLFGSLLILTISSTAATFAPSFPVFTVLFMLMGFSQMAIYITIFVLGSETLIGSTRVLFCSLCLPFVYNTAVVMLPCTAYLVRNWRHLTLLIAVPGLACLPLFGLIQESPRWLVSCGRLEEAERLLRSAALQNRVEPPAVIFHSSMVEKTEKEKSETYNFFHLMRIKKIRPIAFILWVIWLSTSLSFFGISFNLSSLDGSPFITYILSSAVDFPGYTVSWLTAGYFPRRLSYIGCTLVSALALFLLQITMHSSTTLTLVLALLGKFGILAAIGVIYVYTGELFPTVIRNTAMSSCAMFARLGSSVSPYLMQLAVFYEFLPWIVVASLSLVVSLLCAFLPETFRQPLPDTIQELKPIQMFKWPCRNGPTSKDDLRPDAPEVLRSTRF
ncbi:solute carrier family 22 member 5-like [Cynoglossus semilaevis]|uniref:solute carrier family 22 member 5-like n=1 Tax=Cynoglossus semilaevis TaxID=244447 RepID=UPI000D62F6C8|nr:solute carrier family 22 member 5-like [Cynoglossus semilaevis]